MSVREIPMYIDGQPVMSQSQEWRDVVNPATQDVVAVPRPQAAARAVMQDPRGAGAHRQTRGRGVSRALSRY